MHQPQRFPLIRQALAWQTPVLDRLDVSGVINCADEITQLLALWRVVGEHLPSPLMGGCGDCLCFTENPPGAARLGTSGSSLHVALLHAEARVSVWALAENQAVPIHLHRECAMISMPSVVGDVPLDVGFDPVTFAAKLSPNSCVTWYRGAEELGYIAHAGTRVAYRCPVSAELLALHAVTLPEGAAPQVEMARTHHLARVTHPQAVPLSE